MVAYYTGDTVPLSFNLTDASGAVNPSAATVEILKPHNETTTAVNATIDGNVVSYNIPASVNNEGGHYKAYFVCTLSYGERTHKIEYDVIANPEINR